MEQRLELRLHLGQLMCQAQISSILTYMSVGNPGRALAPLQPLDELSTVRDSLGDELLRRDWAGRAVEDGAFAQVGPDALLGEAAREPPLHPLGRLYRNRGGIRILWSQIPRALGSHLVVFTEYRHCVVARCRGAEVQRCRLPAGPLTPKRARPGRCYQLLNPGSVVFGGVLGAARADEPGRKWASPDVIQGAHTP